ncbi:hypothetical protein BpHYR1_001107 [Brachionus plicatilis]|uniref:Uncharacterized protein n=1 Tax=Brachionus plicatilis TaxID=10195 RepID=A0A3M7S7X4_BRAPC|nr:hypothetical protein BpHYR1_001107 [Brachionus plicatilis]
MSEYSIVLSNCTASFQNIHMFSCREIKNSYFQPPAEKMCRHKSVHFILQERFNLTRMRSNKRSIRSLRNAKENKKTGTGDQTTLDVVALVLNLLFDQTLVYQNYNHNHKHSESVSSPEKRLGSFFIFRPLDKAKKTIFLPTYIDSYLIFDYRNFIKFLNYYLLHPFMHILQFFNILRLVIQLLMLDIVLKSRKIRFKIRYMKKYKAGELKYLKIYLTNKYLIIWVNDQFINNYFIEIIISRNFSKVVFESQSEQHDKNLIEKSSRVYNTI